MEYLEAAHTKIEECSDSCKCWCAPYDGENPSPTSLMMLDESPADDCHTIADSDATPVVTPSTEPHGQSVFLDGHKQLEPSGGKDGSGNIDLNASESLTEEEGMPSRLGDKIMIESHGQSPGNARKSMAYPSEEVRSSTPTKEGSPRPEKQSDDVSKLPIIPEGSKLLMSQKDSYAESVTSEADSALSGSSSNTDTNVQNGSENPASRNDSPLNDNFDTMDFNTFLLSLKRVKTPVEFCDNIEDSIHEIDELINDLKHVESHSQKSLSRSPNATEGELPKFVDGATVENTTHIVKPNASKSSPDRLRTSSDCSITDQNQCRPAETRNRTSSHLSDVSLEDKLSEFDSDSSVKKMLETMPHRSSSVSELTTGADRPSSAFTPLKPGLGTVFTPAKYSLGTPNIGECL